MGWVALIWRLSDAAFDAAPEAIRKAIVTGFCVSFALDSADSITSGSGAIALFNVLFLVLFIRSLWRSAKTKPAV